MSLVAYARKLARALPVGHRLAHRLRRAAGLGFEAAAFVRYGAGRRAEAPRPGPIAVIGFHGSVLGIGEGARAFSAALRAAGAEVIDWDISALFGHQRRLEDGAVMTAAPDAAALVIHLNPRELIQLVAMLGPEPFRGRFCVGYWAWELESAPSAWRPALRYVDEVWTPSRFVADAVLALKPTEPPVRVFPHPLPAWTAPEPASLGLAPRQTMVLCAFDVRSGFNRKNPLASVRAFRHAVALAGRPAVMVVKATAVEGAPDLFDQLKAEISDAGDVRLITDWLTGGEMAALIARADVVLSLHRSEGFGLLLAQAMGAGKAVVATGWSGNLDFMTPETAALVDFTLIPVADDQGLYQGGRWAEPDEQDAARKLAALLASPEARAAMGQAAAAMIRPLLDAGRLGRQARGWLGAAEGPAG